MDTSTLRAFRADSRTMIRELGFLQDERAPSGVTHAQTHLLIEIAHAGQLAPGALAERLRSDPAAVSRNIKALSARGLLRAGPDPADGRRRLLSLTDAGAVVVRGVHDDADSQVRRALATLDPASRGRVIDGMRLYAAALRRLRLRRDVTIRYIQVGDDPGVTALLRAVMPELAPAMDDDQVDGMFAAYQAPRCEYWVVARGGQIVGGAGYTPLVGGDGQTCALRKLCLLPGARGLGLAAELIQTALSGAAAEGYAACSLTLADHMVRARAVAESLGFERQEAPLGAVGLDVWYRRALD